MGAAYRSTRLPDQTQAESLKAFTYVFYAYKRTINLQGGDILKKKLRRLLRSERRDASYVSSVIYILVAVILIAFIINVFYTASIKQEISY